MEHDSFGFSPGWFLDKVQYLCFEQRYTSWKSICYTRQHWKLHFLRVKMFKPAHTTVAIWIFLKILFGCSFTLILMIITYVCTNFFQIIVYCREREDQKFYFPCNQWLAKDEGDGMTRRQLTASTDSSAVFQGLLHWIPEESIKVHVVRNRKNYNHQVRAFL